MKAKPSREDNNIFSVLVETPITSKNELLRQQIFRKIPYRDILEKSFWTRPQKIKNVDFNLQDMWNGAKKNIINVSFCPTTNFTGALTEAKTFQVHLKQTSNRLLKFLYIIYDLFCNIFPLSLFKGRRTIGHTISYYGLLDKGFSIVAGTAMKKPNGQIAIEDTQFLTKQISFIIKRIKQKLDIAQTKLLFYTLLQCVILFYFMRWVMQKMKDKKIPYYGSDREVEESQLEHQCIICYGRSRQVIFKPCKHYGLCYNCYRRLNKQQCPVCKKQITSIIRVMIKTD